MCVKMKTCMGKTWLCLRTQNFDQNVKIPFEKSEKRKENRLRGQGNENEREKTVWMKCYLPRSSDFDSRFDRSFDGLYRAAATGSCIEANVGMVRPRCTTKPVCIFKCARMRDYFWRVKFVFFFVFKCDQCVLRESQMFSVKRQRIKRVNDENTTQIQQTAASVKHASAVYI